MIKYNFYMNYTLSWIKHTDPRCIHGSRRTLLSTYIKIRESGRLWESFARLEFRHDGIEGTRIPGVRANVKTHLVHPHERGLARTYTFTYARMHIRIHTHAHVQDSYGATNDWNDLHSMSNRRSLSVFYSASPRPSARSSSPFGLARVTFSEGGAGLI